VTFTCAIIDQGVCPPGQIRDANGICRTPDIAIVNGCRLNRSASGTFTLEVFGRNIKQGATITVGGVSPRKIKFKDPDAEFPGGFTRVRLKGRVCNGLPGSIIVTNPSPFPGIPPVPSQAFACTERCPTS
jgi:hypothetical protein